IRAPVRLEIVRIVGADPCRRLIGRAKLVKLRPPELDLWMQLDLRQPQESSETAALDPPSTRLPKGRAEVLAARRDGVGVDGLVLVGDCVDMEVAVDPDALDPRLWLEVAVASIVVVCAGALLGPSHRGRLAEHRREERDLPIRSQPREATVAIAPTAERPSIEPP